jgi:hypothetical protein
MFEHIRANPFSPDMKISGGSVGMDRTLYYIQLYCYHAEALFFMFWAWTMVSGVYTLMNKPRLQRPLRIFAIGGKVFSVLFPLIIILLLQNETIRAKHSIFLLLAGQPLFWSLGLGGIAMFLVAVRYIQLQRRFQQLSMVELPSASSRPSLFHRRTNSKGTVRSRKNMYDRWLLARFSIAFIFQGVFELTTVLFAAFSEGTVKETLAKSSPDYSVGKAEKTLLFFMPGVTQSLLLFICFGTTKPCLESIRNLFLAHKIQDIAPSPFTSSSSPVLLSTSSAGSPDGPLLKPQKSYQSSSELLQSRDDNTPRIKRPSQGKQKARLMKPLPTLPLHPPLSQRAYLEAGLKGGSRGA